MNIKQSILIASFFLFVINLYPMQQVENISSSAEVIDENVEKSDPAQKNKLNVGGEWTVVCMQKRAEQILPYLPAQLVDIISKYEELPTPDEVKQANMRLDKALKENNPALTLCALNNFANANGKLDGIDDYLTYSVTMNRHPEIIETLLIYRANPNPSSGFLNQSLLHRVSNPCIVPLLIQYKANIDAIDFNGRNALYDNGSRMPPSDISALIKILIDHKLNPNHIDHNGETPLHQTTGAFHHEYVKALLEGKANVHATDRRGNTALHFVTGTIFTDQRVNAMKTMELLINAGADPYTKNNEGKTALDRAKCFDAKRSFKMADAMLKVCSERQSTNNTGTHM